MCVSVCVCERGFFLESALQGFRCRSVERGSLLGQQGSWDASKAHQYVVEQYYFIAGSLQRRNASARREPGVAPVSEP